MTNKCSVLFSQLSVGVAALLSMSAAAQVPIYDNSVNGSGTPNRLALTNGVEYGNEIFLAGTERYLTKFSFEFYGIGGNGATFADNVFAQVRFYQMGGAPLNGNPTPSPIPFWQSPMFEITGPTVRDTLVFLPQVDFPAGGLFIPTSDMTWTVEFTYTGLGDVLGVDMYGPPVVGLGYDDMWVNRGSSWELVHIGGAGATNTVGALFVATPEPSTVALLVLGGLGFLFASRRNRKP